MTNKIKPKQIYNPADFDCLNKLSVSIFSDFLIREKNDQLFKLRVGWYALRNIVVRLQPSLVVSLGGFYIVNLNFETHNTISISWHTKLNKKSIASKIRNKPISIMITINTHN